MSLLNELESLRIPFSDIKESTKNFTTIIGKGGYGVVYKGELLLSGKVTSVAIKRLDGNVSGQGFKEFLTEIQLLTRYKHQNLISLIGFCDQDNEKILIYEYAEHGSLDKYLSTAENRSKLTWKRRINICLNAARGLNYLHNEVATNERVIHRDIKSANVLLDQNWKAMISDLGLSKLGRANEKDTFLITNVSGTHGYCDPVYISSGILTKESDVYSFGVVLFEVLCGRLGCINVNTEHRFLSTLAQRYCKIGKIEEIMDPALKNQVDSAFVNKFSKIASQCLLNNRKRRPSMRTVVKKLEELEKSLELQLSSNTEMNPMLNPRAEGPEGSLIGIPGSNKGSFSSLLTGWPTPMTQKSLIQDSQLFHQLQMLSPQQLLLSQQNMTSEASNDETRRLLNNRHMGKDGLSSSAADIPNAVSQMGVLPRADSDILIKLKIAQMQQQQQQKQQRQHQQQQHQQKLLLAQQNMTSKASNDQNRQLRMLLDKRRRMSKDGLSSSDGDIPNVGCPMGVLPGADSDMLLKLKRAQIQQQQQQILNSLSAPPTHYENLNLQQEEVVGTSSVGDGSMSNLFRGNDQVGRKRKQPVPSSGPANSSGTAGPSPSSGSSTPLITTLTFPLTQLEMA